ncbi:MAG TPA: 4Fe-4S dicluster domain-containing protein [Vicinamibacterales bacterium]|jgi:Fe-S-cluster-containing dehydrogenase component/formate-dependent nitrite reductase membrane component NrfD
MANYGFAIDLRKCIGCHACTIACKAEHEIPVGVNRCWVKTVEKGTFPDTQRFFFPVLCNQCTDAPCVGICPTRALFKRRDGIVDLNGESCIGCRACMEACPYDQLFIDPNTHTAEKCNFCANRVENELLPACVIVCPTECRIFGDLDDPSSAVSRIVQHQAYDVRKPEKGTGPKIFYLGADESVIRPEAAVRPLYFKEGQVHLRPVGAPVEDPDSPGDPRVDYDTPHKKPWGIDMVLYLFFKAVSTGAMMLAALLWLFGDRGALTTIAAPIISIVCISLTTIVLIADLERPERFYYILTRSNWRSWLVWGTWFLAAHGTLSGLWLVSGWMGWTRVIDAIALPALLAAVLATSYTGFLFAQGRGRDLWQGRHGAIHLVAQSGMAGAATIGLAAKLFDIHPSHDVVFVPATVFLVSVVAHLAMLLFENVISSSPTRHHQLAVQAIRHGAFARLFWGMAIAAGGVLPLVLLFVTTGVAVVDSVKVVAAFVLVLAGSAAWDYIWIEAGQSVPLS